jgi:hypothetical protein
MKIKLEVGLIQVFYPKAIKKLTFLLCGIMLEPQGGWLSKG